MNHSKILEQFHYFNIHSEIDSVYGNWVVSTDGDVINYVFPYAIFSIHLKDKNWKYEIKNKVWFKIECAESLNHALERANEILINKNK